MGFSSIFENLDLEGLQRLVFPVIEALGGPAIDDLIAGKSEALAQAAVLLGEAQDLFEVAAEAARDGVFSNEEINQIVAEAGDIGEAYDVLRIAILNKVAK